MALVSLTSRASFHRGGRATPVVLSRHTKFGDSSARLQGQRAGQIWQHARYNLFIALNPSSEKNLNNTNLNN